MKASVTRINTEESQENPELEMMATMLSAKQNVLGESAVLTEEDKKMASDISILPNMSMIRAYEAWRSKLEGMVDIRSQLTQVTEERDIFREKAFHDELTGAYTRHYFTDYLARKVNAINSGRMAIEHRRSGEENMKFSLLAIDIDHFKDINDKHGHDIGDEILKNLVKILQNNLRDEDLVIRYGGEEFFVFLQAGANQAENIANKLRAIVEEEINRSKELGKSGTISIGLTSYDVKNEELTAEQLKKRADLALYKSKNNGRNQVTVYKEENKIPKN